jgi:hypothetical protein
MNAKEFYKHTHGDSPWLSKDAITDMMEAYAEKRYQEYKERKQIFNTEMWVATETFKRANFPKKD